jgi:hypothetical protein
MLNWELYGVPTVPLASAAPAKLGWTLPAALLPQQTAGCPSVGMAQLWKVPALTLLYVPAGGSAWPSVLRPQQVMVPSRRNPQT